MLNKLDLTKILLCFTFFWPIQNHAANTPLQPQLVAPYNVQQYDQDIKQLYRSLPTLDKKPVSERIAILSAYFLNKPYLLGALGEGKQGQYDQNPLYRTDAFDCVTYVSTVLALTISKNLAQFQQAIKDVNYSDGTPLFRKRNHFMSADWNPNNQRKGYVKDITNTIVDKQGQPIAAVARATIDRPNWFKHLKLNQLKLLQAVSLQQTEKLLNQLQTEANDVGVTKSALPYLPFTKLFRDGKPEENIFAQIPSGAIIEIVRPNWQLKKLIGTNMNVSHLGFAIRTPQGLMFREASSDEHKVIDIPLTSYLKQCLKSPTIKGINIQILNKK